MFRKSKEKKLRKQRLKKILSVAHEVARINPEALIDYVRLIGKKIQADYMSRSVLWLDEHEIKNLYPEKAWFDLLLPLNLEGQRAFDLKRKITENKTLNLSSSIVLPWPWKVQRVIENLSTIGERRLNGAWRFDPVDHKVEYWLPFGIAWVKKGNHSIMTGITQGQGQIETDQVFDLSALFPLIRFDGNTFIRNFDNTVIREVDEFEIAAIFEVGRIMHEYGVSA